MPRTPRQVLDSSKFFTSCFGIQLIVADQTGRSDAIFCSTSLSTHWISHLWDEKHTWGLCSQLTHYTQDFPMPQLQIWIVFFHVRFIVYNSTSECPYLARPQERSWLLREYPCNRSWVQRPYCESCSPCNKILPLYIYIPSFLISRVRHRDLELLEDTCMEDKDQGIEPRAVQRSVNYWPGPCSSRQEGLPFPINSHIKESSLSYYLLPSSTHLTSPLTVTKSYNSTSSLLHTKLPLFHVNNKTYIYILLWRTRPRLLKHSTPSRVSQL